MKALCFVCFLVFLGKLGPSPIHIDSIYIHIICFVKRKREFGLFSVAHLH